MVNMHHKGATPKKYEGFCFSVWKHRGHRGHRHMRTNEDAPGHMGLLWSYQRYLSLYVNSYIAYYHEHR